VEAPVSAALGVSRDATRAAEKTGDLYARHGQRVYSFCRSRLRSPEEAQDAAQTAFLYALASLRRGVVPRNELAWLLTIADNVCRSSRRTLGRRLAHVANADVDELEAAAPSLNAETREEIAELRAALAQLPDRQRQAILLREWQGLSYADIAEQLGLSLAAVETLLFRSRRSLMRRLRAPRTRLGVLDLASGASLLRSVLGGTAGKAAAGAAVLAVMAAPVAQHELAAPAARADATSVASTPLAAKPHIRPRVRSTRVAPQSRVRAHPVATRRSAVVTPRAVRPTAAPATAQAPTASTSSQETGAPAPPPSEQPAPPLPSVTPQPVSLPQVELLPVTLPLPPVVSNLPLSLP
jgi:RNA polymerase sigma-70 factor (ECF subfamily)